MARNGVILDKMKELYGKQKTHIYEKKKNEK
jgi:hypothetical protein